MKITKSQIDRLGDRLKHTELSESDLRLLGDDRRFFGDPYQYVVQIIREKLGLDPTGRPIKSTGSIIDKLRRESIRLSQIQDIAGCRIIVINIQEQDRTIESLSKIFRRSIIVDRRELPSHGYRAVHFIPQIDARMIEIQVRTILQHRWAELSEKFADVVDPMIKYGGGNDPFRKILQESSLLVKNFEDLEKRYFDIEGGSLNRYPSEQFLILKEKMNKQRELMDAFFCDIINNQ